MTCRKIIRCLLNQIFSLPEMKFKILNVIVLTYELGKYLSLVAQQEQCL